MFAFKETLQPQLAFIRLPDCPQERNAYPPGFFRWLNTKEGATVWNEFERRAYAMAEQGRPRYSARTIMEVIRWNTDISDGTVTFKISNNWIPGLARLFMFNHGHRFPKFFDIRGSE